MASLWNTFRTTPLGELLTGTAHQAHPTDITAPLGVRFAGRTILAVHIALDKAATVRVAFSTDGNPRLSGIRNIKQRNSGELLEVLRTEATATRAEWAVIVLATGWQAVLGQRAARPDPTDAPSRFGRHKLMFESPEVVVPRAQVDRVYTAVDHPVLDKSVVFSVKRRELEALLAEIRKANLEIASVRIAVAAQLELWLVTQGESALARDLLITDGLSALLLNVEAGDFVPPRGAVEAEQPRQSVQRPSAIEEDIARFLSSNAGRSVTFIGPEELCVAVKKHVAEAEIIRPPVHAGHDTQHVVLLAPVQHELNFEARDVRPALPKSWRNATIGCVAVGLLLGAVAVINALYAARTGYESYRLEREAATRVAESEADAMTLSKIAADFTDASATRSWVAGNYHAQQFCYRLLKEIPATAALEKLLVEMKDGQITLEFVVLGDQDAQLGTHRAIENAIKDLKYKIGGEELPVGTAGMARAVQYRMHIIVPDAGEVAAP